MVFVYANKYEGGRKWSDNRAASILSSHRLCVIYY